MRTDNEQLLDAYKKELTYLRKMGSNFAEQYPKIGGRLELSPYECPDPHVERLIESFAFLTARIQRKLDSELPEISTAMLDVLYPQYLNPIPSMAIARLEMDPAQGKLSTGYKIEKQTPLFTQTKNGTICRFRTCYPVVLWPVEVVHAGFESTTQYDFLDHVPDVTTLLKIRLKCQGDSFQELEMKKLRFYLNGDRLLTNSLYELLFCHVRRVAILSGGSTRPVYLPKEAIRPVGFGVDEEVLPYPSTAHPGYRLLQEYFTFPEKFLFFDIDYLDRHQSAQYFDILVLLDRIPKERLAVDQSTFCLGCTPIINLFRKISEPIRLDHRSFEYPLIPDIRREKTTEIHSILSVSSTSNEEDETKLIAPFFSYNHHLEQHGQKAFWFARRKPTNRKDIPGTEMHLSFVDLDFNPQLPPVQTIYAHTLCTNRQLAEQVPAGALLQIEEVAPLARIYTLNKSTIPINPPLGGTTLWRLLSHLSLNYLSLSNGKESLQALKEILKLYSFSEQPSIYHQINGIWDMSCRQVIQRIGNEAWRGFCRGTEVTLVFDERAYVGGSSFLLASVLNHFFALYSSVNSFTQLVVKSVQREEVWKRWEPMVGKEKVM